MPCLVRPLQFLWWMAGSVAELLQGRTLSRWSGAGLVPPCPDDQPLMSNETLQTRARNILIEISRWSILCLHCVRYWVPIMGNAGHYTLTSSHQTWHGDIPLYQLDLEQEEREENLDLSLWDLCVMQLSWTYISSYLIFCWTVRWRWPDYRWLSLISQNSTCLWSLKFTLFTISFINHCQSIFHVPWVCSSTTALQM